MRIMNEAERKQIEIEVEKIIRMAVSDDYSSYIFNQRDGVYKETFIDAVIRDVMESSAWEDEGYYNEDDIRLSIGRIFIERMGIVIQDE